MSSFKLAAIDLDDTLLNDSKEISKFTIGTIKIAAAKGIKIILATGRCFRGAVKYYNKLGLETPIITCGGAVVADKNCVELFKLPINPEIAREILFFAKEKKVHAQIENSMEYCFEENNEYSELHKIFYGFAGVEIPDLINKKDITASKVLIISKPEIIDRVQPEAERRFPSLLISRSLPSFLEFNNPDSSKGKALKFLSSYLSIMKDSIISIGDSALDIELFKYSGFKVAMGNASKEIKEAADYITGTNNDDGAAKAIEKFLL